MSEQNYRILIAGGGTGGHVFPMISVADALREQNSGNEMLFVGTARGIESRLVPEADYALKTISFGGLKGKSIVKRLTTLLQIPVAVVRSMFIISKFGPHVVLGGGGYASWPVCYAATLLGVPLALLEVNSLPGLANRKLSRRAREAYIAFESTGEMLKCRSVLTGNPIRSEVRGEPPVPRHSRPMRLLIVGGSQGAIGLNTMVIEALPALAAANADIDIVHQTGKADFDRVKQAYEGSGFNLRVEPFITDMAAAYREADLVVCRSGATTVAELIAARRPAIFVPLPTAADNHQEINAREVVQAGGGELLRQNVESGPDLARRVMHWYDHPAELAHMGEALAALDHRDSARIIANHLIGLAEQNKGS